MLLNRAFNNLPSNNYPSNTLQCYTITIKVSDGAVDICDHVTYQ